MAREIKMPEENIELVVCLNSFRCVPNCIHKQLHVRCSSCKVASVNGLRCECSSLAEYQEHMIKMGYLNLGKHKRKVGTRELRTIKVIDD